MVFYFIADQSKAETDLIIMWHRYSFSKPVNILFIKTFIKKNLSENSINTIRKLLTTRTDRSYLIISALFKNK